MSPAEGSNALKLAIVTDDGRTVSQHFGRAAYYLVIEIADGEIKGHEYRPRKAPCGGHGRHHHHDHDGHHHDHHHGQGHGSDPQAADRHAAMADKIKDCQLLIAGGMGRGAAQAMEAAGIRVVMTNLASIEDVLAALAAGRLQDRRERMH